MVAQLNRQYLQISAAKSLQRIASWALFEGRPVTTRGRWINPVLMALQGALERMPLATPVEAPIHIVGMGRSGTTALGLTLSLHSSISFLNEPKLLWWKINSCDDLVGNYGTSDNGQYIMTEESVSPLIRRRAHRLFGAYLRITGGKRLLNKYPEMIFRASYLKRLFPDSKFLFISRDLQASATSVIAWSRRHGERHEGGARSLDWWGRDDIKWRLIKEQLVQQDEALSNALGRMEDGETEATRATIEWICTMRAGLKLLRRFPADTYHLRYEDWTADPEWHTANILDFCSLVRESKCLSYAREKVSSTGPRGGKPTSGPLQPFVHELRAHLGYAAAE